MQSHFPLFLAMESKFHPKLFFCMTNYTFPLYFFAKCYYISTNNTKQNLSKTAIRYDLFGICPPKASDVEVILLDWREVEQVVG